MNYLEKRYQQLEENLKGISSNPKAMCETVSSAISFVVEWGLSYTIMIPTVSEAIVIKEFVNNIGCYFSRAADKDCGSGLGYWISP